MRSMNASSAERMGLVGENDNTGLLIPHMVVFSTCPYANSYILYPTMKFEDLLAFSGDRLSNDPKDVARYEYIWNNAIRAAARVCQESADQQPDYRNKAAAEACAELIMQLWHSELSIR